MNEIQPSYFYASTGTLKRTADQSKSLLIALVLLILLAPLATPSIAQGSYNILSYKNFFRDVLKADIKGSRVSHSDNVFVLLDFVLRMNFVKQIKNNLTGNILFLNFPLPSDIQAYVESNYAAIPLAAEPMRFVVGTGISTRIVLSTAMVNSIYAGKIRYWDDTVIAAANLGSKLPHQLVVPFYSYRSKLSDKALILSAGDSGSTFALFQFLSAIDPVWQQKMEFGIDTIYKKGETDIALSYASYPALASKYSISLVPEHLYQQVYRPRNIRDIVLTNSSLVPFPLTNHTVIAAMTADGKHLKTGPFHHFIEIDNPSLYPLIGYEYGLVPRHHVNRQALEHLNKMLNDFFTLSHGQEEKLGYYILTPELQNWDKTQMGNLLR